VLNSDLTKILPRVRLQRRVNVRLKQVKEVRSRDKLGKVR